MQNAWPYLRNDPLSGPKEITDEVKPRPDGNGVESRVLSIFSFWLVIAVSLLGDAILSALAPPRRIALASIGAAAGVLLGIGHIQRGDDWARAWQAQQAVLREAPVARIEATPVDAAIVYLGTPSVANAPIFVAPWDLNPAMELTFGSRAVRQYVVYTGIEGQLTWNGTVLSYPQHVISKNVPVFVWQPGARFDRALHPFRVDRDRTVRDFTP